MPEIKRNDIEGRYKRLDGDSAGTTSSNLIWYFRLTPL